MRIPTNRTSSTITNRTIQKHSTFVQMLNHRFRFIQTVSYCTCPFRLHLPFLHRQRGRKELSLNEGLQAGHRMAGSRGLTVQILSQRQKLMASARSLQMNHFGISQPTKNYQIRLKIYDGS